MTLLTKYNTRPISEALQVGQWTWIVPWRLTLGTDGGLWFDPSDEMLPGDDVNGKGPQGTADVKLMRTDDGYTADITRTTFRWSNVYAESTTRMGARRFVSVEIIQ